MFRFSYVTRIIVILAGALVGGLIIKMALVPESFGKYGHYRGNWLNEATQYPLNHQGKFICQECHNEIFQNYEKDVHISV